VTVAFGLALLFAASPSSDLLRQGIAAFERGDEAAAVALFRQALEANPADGAAHAYLGALADRAGRLDDAERHFAAAAAADPTSASARNNHGAILLRLGRTADAEAAFEAALRADSRHRSALVNLAQLRAAGGTPDGLHAARELFERAQAQAADAEVARALVAIALRMGQRQAAATSFRAYAALAESGGPAVSGPAPRAELGGALLAGGLASEAAQELGAAVAAGPGLAPAAVLLSRAQLATGDHAGATATLDAALARGLDDAVVHSALADLYETGGSFERAIPAMRRAIERDPANESYRFRYAMLLIRAKAPAAAVIRMEEALTERPRSSRLWFALGLARFSDQKNDEAAAAFDRAMELDPRFAPALAYRGLTHVAAGRYPEALALYERALAIDDQLAVAHYLAGEAVLRLVSPDHVRAEQSLTRAVALNPTLTPARLTLAKLYLQTDRAAEAAAELERVVALEPNLAQAQYQLGRAYVRLKRTAEAQAVMAAFKRLSDEQRDQAVTERQDLLRRLAEIRF
jgi:tetratricopeptide (TPR) repeat protein